MTCSHLTFFLICLLTLFACKARGTSASQTQDQTQEAADIEDFILVNDRNEQATLSAQFLDTVYMVIAFNQGNCENCKQIEKTLMNMEKTGVMGSQCNHISIVDNIDAWLKYVGNQALKHTFRYAKGSVARAAKAWDLELAEGVNIAILKRDGLFLGADDAPVATPVFLNEDAAIAIINKHCQVR